MAGTRPFSSRLEVQRSAGLRKHGSFLPCTIYEELMDPLLLEVKTLRAPHPQTKKIQYKLVQNAASVGCYDPKMFDGNLTGIHVMTAQIHKNP